jgi:hypothetical protein
VNLQSIGDRNWRADFDHQFDAVLVRGQARVLNGQLSITRLEIVVNTIDVANFTVDAATGAVQENVPTPAPGSITADVLRHVHVGRYAEEIRRQILDAETGILPPRATAAARAREVLRKRAVADLPANAFRRGRPGLGDDHYRRVAEEAIRLRREGSRSVRADLGRLYNRQGNTIRDWLKEARDREWLAKTGRGQRGGEAPGPRLLEAWKGESFGT